MPNVEDALKDVAKVLLEEVANEGDPAPDGFEQGVTLALEACTQATKTGWDPAVDPMPASPDGLESGVEGGFLAFCSTVDALAKKDTKH